MKTEIKEAMFYGSIVLAVLLAALLVLWFTSPDGSLLPDIYSVM